MVGQHKRRRLPRRERQARTRGMGMACGFALMLGAVGIQRMTDRAEGKPQFDKTLPGRAVLTPIAYRAQTPPDVPQPTPAVTILADAQTPQPADPAALRDVLASTVTSLDVSSDGEPSASSPPAWFAWARLDASRAGSRITASPNFAAEGLGAYAVRGDWGTALCLVNKTNARILTTAQFRLPKGVYAIERLVLGKREEGSLGAREKGKGRRESEADPQPSTINRASTGSPEGHQLSPLLPLPSTTFTRLEGCDLGSVTTVCKGFCLEPGQICLYRCLDTAHAARAAWYDVYTQLHGMGAHHPGPAHRLGTMLHEADSYIGGVRGGNSGGGRHEGLQSRLGCIHHLLLVTAQAHSLHHNYQMRHTVEEAEGKTVMAALDRLTDALSETSAVLLGLVPQVSIEAEEGSKNRSAGKKENEVATANNETGRVQIVTVTLANTGDHSVSNVKLGLNPVGLPAGIACDPADPAYFDALHPGQTVRATFHLRGASAGLPNLPLSGDVSYFTGTAPAHLRPRAW